MESWAWRQSALAAVLVACLFTCGFVQVSPLSSHPNPYPANLGLSQSIADRTDASELLAQGRKEAALAAFERATELNPSNGNNFIQLGRLVSEVGSQMLPIICVV